MNWVNRRAGNRYCLVGLQIGEVYGNYWNLAFRKSWEAYASRHGYDILIVDAMIDPAAGEDVAAIKFQKLKLFSLQELAHYQRVVFADSDIFMTDGAPCVASLVRDGRIGMVSQMAVPYREWYEYIQPIRGGDVSVEAYYSTHLLPEEQYLAEGVTDIFNGGVIVADPRQHGALLEELYALHLPNSHKKTGHIDQPILSCELSRRGLIQPLDFRFNVIFSMWVALHYSFISESDEVAMRAVVQSVLPLVHFLHFPSMRGVQHLPKQYFTVGES
jgi:hypothetical protein